MLAERLSTIGEDDIFDELEEATGIDFCEYLEEPEDSCKNENKEYSELNDLFAGM